MCLDVMEDQTFFLVSIEMAYSADVSSGRLQVLICWLNSTSCVYVQYIWCSLRVYFIFGLISKASHMVHDL